MSPPAEKALASLVIVTCLGVQTLEILRPHHGWLWPFLDYPMYATSYQPGSIAGAFQLRVASCDSPAHVWQVWPREIGHPPFRLRERLGEIAWDTSSAAVHRAALNRVVSTHVKPRPCVLQVWEREVITTAKGVNPSAFARPQWALRRAWSLDSPDDLPR